MQVSMNGPTLEKSLTLRKLLLVRDNRDKEE